MTMNSNIKTKHKILFESSNDMKKVPSKSINLIVTSPPYPMIEMWDQQFSTFNPEIIKTIQAGKGAKAHILIHEELNKVWKEVERVLSPGGIACINIGDATRKISDSFQLYSNHSHVISCFEGMGFQCLPLILWRKESNKPNKFMGSGMMPPGAYVTLEHEHILIFRKGGKREFSSKDKEIRRKSAYFWEERNIWFSDVWTGLKGISQKLNHIELRECSAAYPFELAYRIINMFSIQGDTILDPFLGTGTTTLAAMTSARNSIGYELDLNFNEVISSRINEIKKYANEIIQERLANHVLFVKHREKEKGPLKYKSVKYEFPVVTRQETNILIPVIEKISKTNENEFEVEYSEEIPKEIKIKPTTLP